MNDFPKYYYLQQYEVISCARLKRLSLVLVWQHTYYVPFDLLMIENSLDRRKHFVKKPWNEHTICREAKAQPQSYELLGYIWALTEPMCECNPRSSHSADGWNL
ncbi:hypothetical protein FPOAC2_05019 [Fusarium poae]